MAFLGLGRRPAYRGNPNALTAASLTAAGFRVTHRDSDQMRRLLQPQQARAFSYYDQLGEIKYAAQFYKRMLAPLRLFVSKRDEKGDWIELEGNLSGDDQLAVETLDRLRDPGGGGRKQLQANYGRLMFIAGESYLLTTYDEDIQREQWEIVSTDELRIQSGVYMRYKAPSLNAEEYHEPADDDWEEISDEKQAVAYRLWQPHPRYSMLADSTMMGVLDDCEELLLLKRAIRARARSRLASAGILAISEDFSYAPLEPEPDEDPQSDPFLADFTSAVMTAIQNEGSASAAVPMLLRGPTEAIEKGIRHIQIVDPTQLYPETGLRMELLQRIAIGLDMPPEALLGYGDANHWTAWQIDEQTWKGHGMPIAEQMVGDFNTAWYLPQLRADGVVEWDAYRIDYDPSEVINHPNRAQDAKDAYKARAVGKKYLRDALGIPDDAEPTQEELNEMIGVEIRDGSLALYGIPSVKSGGIEAEPGVVTNSQGESGTDTGATDNATVEAGPPASGAPSSDSVEQGLAASANGHRAVELGRIMGASQVALGRAREVAGNRVRSLAKRDPEALRLLEGVPAHRVVAVLGPERVAKLGAEEPRLLVAPARALLLDALRVFGIVGLRAEAIAEQLERYAARTLYEENPAPLPAQFQAFLDGAVAVP